MFLIIFSLGLAVGFLAHRYGLCIFGALLEWIELGSTSRFVAIAAAVLVFAWVHVSGYRHGVEHPGALFLIGGLIQGVGYYLASGCPLALLVRLGEGSKFHVVVFVGFLVGMGLYTGLLQRPVKALLGPVSIRHAQTFPELFR